MKWYKTASLIGPLYHGTTTPFEEFNPGRMEAQSLYGPGFYFTDSPDVASGYAMATDNVKKRFLTEGDLLDFAGDNPNLTLVSMETEENPGIRGTLPPYEEVVATFYDSTKYLPNVKPVYLDLKNPFDIDNSRLTPEQLVEMGWDRLYGSGMATRVDVGNVKRIVQNNPSRAAELPRWLREFGYDGITHVGGELTGTDPHQVYIAFDASQIVPKYSKE